jgi:uncharacterized protein involved in exopolysaccharide biosynthesis
LDTALDRARDQKETLEFRIQEQQRLGTLAKSIAPGETAALPGLKGENASAQLAATLISKRAQLAEAQSRFTPKHPDVIRLAKEIEDLEQQLSTVPQPAADGKTATGKDEREASQMELSIGAEIAQAKNDLDIVNKTIARREKEREGILRSINVYQNRLNLAPALDQELLTLMREHDAKQQQVANLGTRKFNAQMAANAVSERKNDIYRILDEASLPERPVFPSRLHIILIGIGAGLVAGFAAAFGREYFDASLADEEEAAAVLKIPVLASIPEIPEGSR